MPTTRKRDTAKEAEQLASSAKESLIGDQVLGILGKPADLLRVQVRQLGDNRYRVNVYVGADITSGRVANSYFILVDDSGKITSATPEIQKSYGLAAEGMAKASPN